MLLLLLFLLLLLCIIIIIHMPDADTRVASEMWRMWHVRHAHECV